MSARPLPVRPEPRPGEPLTSYAVRLADANGIHHGRVLPRYRHDVDVPATELGESRPSPASTRPPRTG